MLHWHYVGHFDPCDAIDRSRKPNTPKVIRAIPEEAVVRVLESFGRDVEEYLSYYPEGFVLCNWSLAPYKLWDRVHRFAQALADAEGAVIMSEDFVVESQLNARQAQRAMWAKKNAEKGVPPGLGNT